MKKEDTKEGANAVPEYGDNAIPEHHRGLSLFFFCAAATYIMYDSAMFKHLTTVNFAVQLVLFIITACIPAWRTGRMSYVDVAWPWGLFTIGVLTFALSEGFWVRRWMVCGCYFLMGGRMGFGAFMAWRMGKLE